MSQMLVRREVLEVLLASSKWSSKLEAAKTNDEVVKIVVGFAEERGFKVEEVEL